MARNENLKILNWNANGIFNKKNELEDLLNRKKIDVCFVTETRLNSNKIFNLTNYNCYRNDRVDPNGGVMLLFNKKFNAMERQINPIALNNIKTFELLAVELNNCILA